MPRDVFRRLTRLGGRRIVQTKEASVRLSIRLLLPVALTVLVASVVMVSVAPATTSTDSAATATKYVVMYKGNGVPATAAAGIRKAGGTLVASYDAIGVAIADS